MGLRMAVKVQGRALGALAASPFIKHFNSISKKVSREENVSGEC